jgi:hypothetical protein
VKLDDGQRLPPTFRHLDDLACDACGKVAPGVEVGTNLPASLAQSPFLHLCVGCIANVCTKALELSKRFRPR